jgi:hypothetical protein
MAKPNRQAERPAPKPTPQAAAPQARPAAKNTPSVFGQRNDQLIFNRETYKWMLIGLVIMAVGFICMAGGSMPSPDVWDESLIYSPVRTIVAPFLIIAGLVVQVYAIFKKN